MVLTNLEDMEAEDVEIDLSTRSGNVEEEFFETSTSGDAVRSLEQFANVGEPLNGMEFESKEAVYYFYREYARVVGFGITIKASRRSKSVKKGLQLALEEEGVKLMLDYFMDMQEKQPGFFYAVDFDCEKHVRNVLWIDAKAKHDYCSFSDVVLFDTFYVRSGYRIPFVPFVGTNHHCQYVLLGCALIGEESESTFSWLFRTWLKAIGGQAPGVMVTDQDKLVSDIVAQFFPSARHCYCLWNVVSKIPEMLDPFVSQDDGFMESFVNCLNSSWTDEQFESRWSELIGKFDLNENEWVQLLFRDRKKWVPHYLHGICLAGISGPERSGSIASHFDKYMNSEATFKDIFELYMKFLQYRCDVEAKGDLESQSKQPTMRSSLAFEKQLSLTYTNAAFKKFQAEVLGIVTCQLQKEREDGTTAIFHVEDFEKRQSFSVTLNKELLDVCCSSYLFEYQGFLCKHAMLVLQNSDVFCIPSQYILKRWSRNSNNREEKNKKCATTRNRMARFDDLCRRFVKLGEVASLSDEAYKTALKLLEGTLKHRVSVNNSPKFFPEPEKIMTNASTALQNEVPLDSLSKKKKPLKKRKAYYGPGDAANRPEELRQETVQSSIAHTFENCYFPQADMEESELGPRTATLGVYYSTQQNIQGFSSASSIQDGYYGHPHTMQAMGNMHPVHGRISQYESQPSIQGAFQEQSGFRGSAIRGCYDIEETLHDMRRVL